MFKRLCAVLLFFAVAGTASAQTMTLDQRSDCMADLIVLSNVMEALNETGNPIDPTLVEGTRAAYERMARDTTDYLFDGLAAGTVQQADIDSFPARLEGSKERKMQNFLNAMETEGPSGAMDSLRNRIQVCFNLFGY